MDWVAGMHFPEWLIGAALVTLGAILGTSARFFISGFVARRIGETFPWGTLVVNVSGCLVMGLAAAYAGVHSLAGTSNFWLLCATGFLGSYTTVSSFALQTLALARNGETHLSLGYVTLSVALCLAAVATGYVLAVPLFAGAAA
jgi:fluoride exporter